MLSMGVGVCVPRWVDLFLGLSLVGRCELQFLGDSGSWLGGIWDTENRAREGGTEPLLCWRHRKLEIRLTRENTDIHAYHA